MKSWWYQHCRAMLITSCHTHMCHNMVLTNIIVECTTHVRNTTSLHTCPMTSLLECLAKNGDASLSIGRWAPQKIVDAFLARNNTICNICTVASFGRSALWDYTVNLHSTLFILVVLSVFGWHVHVHFVLNWNVHLNEWSTFRIDRGQIATFTTIITLRTRYV